MELALKYGKELCACDLDLPESILFLSSNQLENLLEHAVPMPEALSAKIWGAWWMIRDR